MQYRETNDAERNERDKQKKKAKYQRSVLHDYEFSPMARATRTKNKRRMDGKFACRNNKAGRNRQDFDY